MGEEEKAETKDYLDPTLFDDVKRVTYDDLEESEDIDEKVGPDQLSQYMETLSDIGQHQIVTGRVIGQNEKEIIMDIGFKSEGIIPRSDFMDEETPSIGDVLDVYLERMEDSSGQTILSKEKADWMKRWNKIVEVYENKETVEGKIVRRIKGGWWWIWTAYRLSYPALRLTSDPFRTSTSIWVRKWNFASSNSTVSERTLSCPERLSLKIRSGSRGRPCSRRLK